VNKGDLVAYLLESVHEPARRYESMLPPDMHLVPR